MTFLKKKKVCVSCDREGKGCVDWLCDEELYDDKILRA